jgi:hypothetical protein
MWKFLIPKVHRPIWMLDPKELDIQSLCVLHGALIARLLLANEEVRRRFADCAEAGKGLSGAEEPVAALEKRAKELFGFSLVLKQVLESGLAKKESLE